MDHFHYQSGQLYAEEVALADIGKQFGTPCYVYSRRTLLRHWHAFNDALGEQPHLICYAVKANSNLAILQLLAKEGSGFDVVSVGELERVVASGGDPAKVVFSGVGKRPDEIRRALQLGIYCFNLESVPELEVINTIAGEMGCVAPIAFRINPDVDAKTHPYIATGLHENKFGIDIKQVMPLLVKANGLEHVKLIGIDCHIGSQLTELPPFLDALSRLQALLAECRSQGIDLKHLNLGGGLGVRYQDETPPHPSEHAKAVKAQLADPSIKLILEPGRAIAANAGVLLTDVLYLKHNAGKHFAIVDAAMNDLLRPALYQAWQEIIPVIPRTDVAEAEYDVVGPVCETGDKLGSNRRLAIKAGDQLAIRGAGAYGFSMSSNYNSRPRPAEVLVDGDKVHLIRERETIAQLFANEHLVS